MVGACVSCEVEDVVDVAGVGNRIAYILNQKREAAVAQEGTEQLFRLFPVPCQCDEPDVQTMTVCLKHQGIYKVCGNHAVCSGDQNRPAVQSGLGNAADFFQILLYDRVVVVEHSLSESEYL